MKSFNKHLKCLLVFVLSIINLQTTFAQCSASGTQSPTTTLTPTSTFQSASSCNRAGDYILFNVTAGNIYTFSTCSADGSNITYVSQLTLYNNSNLSTSLAYSDYACGSQARIEWLATFTGVVRLKLNQYYCSTNAICGTVRYKYSPGPCSTITAVNDCDNTNTSVIEAGKGAYALAPNYPAGKERIYSFTPSATGIYTIEVTSNSYSYFTDFFYKVASGGCNGTGWNYINSIYNTGSITTPQLTAGVSYYFMLDEIYYTTGGTIEWKIGCYSDPCLNVVASNSCGVTNTTIIDAGGGQYSLPPYNYSPGKEGIYTFTPDVTGIYNVVLLSNNFPYGVFLYYKPVSEGCNGTGWTYITSASNGTIETPLLTGGVSYYFMWDPYYSTSGGTFTWKINCYTPPPPNDLCSAVTPVTLTPGVTEIFTGTTAGATSLNDGSFNSNPTVWHAFTLSQCASVSVDYCASSPALSIVWPYLATSCPGLTYVYADSQTQNCTDGGANWKLEFNDLAPGTYWIPVMGGENANTPGPYSLLVTATSRCAPPANDDCNGAIPVTCWSSTEGTTGNATPDITDCNSFSSPGVWYSLTPESGVYITASLCHSSFNTYISVYSGSCGSLTCMDQNDDFCGPQSKLTFYGKAGVTYYLLVNGHGSDAGTFTLDISCSANPPNDFCSDVTPVTLTNGVPQIFKGNTIAATQNGDEYIGSGVPTVWHAFTITSCADVTLDYCSTNPELTQVWKVLARSCPGQDQVQANSYAQNCNNGSANWIVVFNNLPAGTYWIPIRGGGYENTPGPYSLSVTAVPCPPTPINDDCSAVTSVTLTSGVPQVFTGTTVSATIDNPLIYPAVFHKITTTTSTNLTISFCGTSPAYGFVYKWLSRQCPLVSYYIDPSSYVMNSNYEDASCTDGNYKLYYYNLAAGTYWIPVAGNYPGYNKPGPYIITVTAVECPVPPNDDCSAVTPVTLTSTVPQVFTGTTSGSAPDGGLTIPTVFHAITTTTCTNITLSYCGSSIAKGALIGDSWRVISIQCPVASSNYLSYPTFIHSSYFENTSCEDGNRTEYYYNLPAGTYWIPVMASNTATGVYTLTVTAVECAIPVNNNCSNVTPVTLALGVPQIFTGTTVGATSAGDGLFSSHPTVWHAFTITTCSDVTIDYCGTANRELGSVWIALATSCPTNNSIHAYGWYYNYSCDNLPVIFFNNLPAGTYWIPVLGLDQSSYTNAGQYSITVTAAECSPPPPPNDDCSAVASVTLECGVPQIFTGTTLGATPDGALNYPTVFHKIRTTSYTNLTISYCGTSHQTSRNVWIVLSTQCPLAVVYPDPTFIRATWYTRYDCGDGNYSLHYYGLPPGTYWIPVMGDQRDYNMPGPYTITVVAETCWGDPPVINCPENISVANDAGQCGAIVSFEATATGQTPVITYSQNPGTFFPVGTTTVTSTATNDFGNANCSFTVTVNDNQPPSITCPANVVVNTASGQCSAVVSNDKIGQAIASDNCSANPTITHTAFPAGNVFPVGTTAITWTATDASGNKATCTQTITVNDVTPPLVTVSVSPAILWPPNHTMKDVFVNSAATDNCGSSTCTLTVTSNEPENGTGDGDTSPDWIIVDDHHVKLRAERSASGSGRIYTITLSCTDAAGNSSAESATVVVAHNITMPVSGNSFKVGSTVNFAGTFWDKPGNTHTGKWLIDDNTLTNGTITEPSGNQNGKSTGNYKFNTPGVYKLQMNITDQSGVSSYANTNGDLEAIAVIYDPNGGYTYGGGWYQSQAGAVVSNPSASGKASYGFTVNYYKGATNPKGESQFEFKVGNLEFNALNFDYLVIQGAKAQFKGTGKTIINGVEQGGIAFIMTVIDGQATGGGGVDKIRMKIYNKNTGVVIYDNQPGASDAADPTMTAGNASKVDNIVVVNTSGSSISNNSSVNTQMEVNTKFNVRAIPNPTTRQFSLYIESSSNEKVHVRLYDALGRKVVDIEKSSGQIIRFGEKLGAGVYIAEVTQGINRKTIKLVKQ